MSWIQRYKVRNYVQNSIWLLSVLGMGAGLVSVRCLLWIEQRASWQSDFDPDGASTVRHPGRGHVYVHRLPFLHSVAGGAVGQRAVESSGHWHRVPGRSDPVLRMDGLPISFTYGWHKIVEGHERLKSDE
jgi:hypothetical protein